MNPPGGLLAVLRDDVVREVRIEGVADARTGEPLTEGSLFYVGSVAKQFVAACAALLIADAALQAEAPVGAYVDGLPDWGDAVRVRHLIHHTSGIPDRSLDESPGVPVTGVPDRGNEDLLAEIRAVEALAFPPGARYAYSNRGYHLLGQVLAAASGERLASLARARLFDPLGMRDTFFRDTPTPLPAAAARGHFVAVDGRRYVEPGRFHAVGAGGLWTTLADLARWDAAFYDEGSVATRLTERGALDDGTPIHYAWGLSVRTHRGEPIHSHGGSFPGWAAKMVRFPAQRTTVIALANHEGSDVSTIAFEEADRILAGVLDPAAPHAAETFDGTA